jgi:CRISPR-associated protein Csx10
VSIDEVAKQPGELALTLDFLSDWHVGSGTGRPGDLDRLVRRGRDGLPVVPAKTLIGVWRDACERLAIGLDEGESAEPWQALVRAVFGSAQAGESGGGAPAGDGQGAEARSGPRSAGLALRPLRLSPQLRAALAHRDRRPVRDACTLVRPGVRIDPDTGQARPQFLRFEEVARRGMRLHGSMTLDLDGRRSAGLALLVAGAALVERLGGKRRRGLGRCSLTVAGLATQDAVDWLEAHPKPPAPASVGGSQPTGAPSPASSSPTATPPPVSSPAGPAPAAQETAAGSWQSVALKLVPATPVVAAAATVGNVTESLDHVPGRLLLSGVAAALNRAGVDAGAAIAEGELVVTNAVPVFAAGGSAVPGRATPAALAVGKDGELADGSVYNRFIDPPPDGAQLKALRGGWVDQPEQHHRPRRATTPLQVATHNTIDDATQRPTSDVGGVYTYEAIAEDTPLHAEVRLSGRLAAWLAEHAPHWHAELAGAWQLGRSLKDDYGLVHATVEAPVAIPSAEAVADRSPAADGQLTVWLLSDALVLDDQLRASPTIEAVAAALGEALGVTLRLRESTGDFVDAVVWERRGEGWQTRWGLPRPSMPAVGAGSCFVVEVDGEVDSAALAAVECCGIGRRRAEGYGQVALNDPLLTASATARPNPPEPGGPADQPAPQPGGDAPPRLLVDDVDDADAETAARIERAAWRAHIRDAAERLAAAAATRHELLGWCADTGLPPASQLGGLQAALLTGGDDLAGARAWLEDVKATANRCDKWPGQSLETLDSLLSNPLDVWSHLGLGEAADTEAYVVRADAEARLRQELHGEAVRTLLVAALRHHRRDAEAAADAGAAADAAARLAVDAEAEDGVRPGEEVG